MIARLALWRPRAGLVREESLRAWERHARLVEGVPGLRRYVQNHVVPTPDGTEPAYAGVGEVWFDDVASARSALASPEWIAVMEDAAGFMDSDAVVVTWVEQRLVREPSP